MSRVDKAELIRLLREQRDKLMEERSFAAHSLDSENPDEEDSSDDDISEEEALDNLRIAVLLTDASIGPDMVDLFQEYDADDSSDYWDDVLDILDNPNLNREDKIEALVELGSPYTLEDIVSLIYHIYTESAGDGENQRIQLTPELLYNSFLTNVIDPVINTDSDEDEDFGDEDED